MTDRRTGGRGCEAGRPGGLMPWSGPSVSAPGPALRECPAGGASDKSEVDESAQVDRSGAQREAVVVALDAAVADPAMSVCDEPGDGTFDHGSPLPVVVGEVAVAPSAAGCDEFGVVVTDVEDAALLCGGAAFA